LGGVENGRSDAYWSEACSAAARAEDSAQHHRFPAGLSATFKRWERLKREVVELNHPYQRRSSVNEPLLIFFSSAPHDGALSCFIGGDAMRLLYMLIQLFIVYPFGYYYKGRPVMVKVRVD
jgi:hypothetical protein